MSLEQSQLQLPDSLQTQLLDFRRKVWTIKSIEAVCGALFGLFVAFLVTFGLDRVWDTPAAVRTAIFAGAMLGCAMVPLALHRWVWRQRQLEQLARLLARRHPSVGDQLLGIIELVRNEDEQARSLTLCQAAVKQVAEVAAKRDFNDSVPNPKHRRRAVMASTGFIVAVVLLIAVPDAATNAWARLFKPWGDTPRYTFAAIDSLPEKLIVPHGEPFTFRVNLTKNSAWRPQDGEVQLGSQQPVMAQLKDSEYAFELPAQIDNGELTIRIGDFHQKLRVEPTLRPELTGLAANVKLPSYLERKQDQKKDVRGGVITLVKGSNAEFVATVSRDLASAQVDGTTSQPTGATVASPRASFDGSRKIEFQWKDQFGLAGKEPFTLTVNSKDDEAPSISAEELPRQKVILDSEQLSFKVRAADDFGVKRVGLDWEGVDKTTVSKPAKGERVLAAGDPEKELLELAGTFSAVTLGIEPQPVQMRLFVEDYLPGRERVYSTPYLFYVLNKEQHAIWITEQLSKWHRQSLEVRDKEMALHETNKQLRGMSSEELDQPENRKRLESQAAAERANGRRLTGLVGQGEELVRQAMKNPDFGVGHIEKWAEMLQIMKDISGNRMPSVAELLKQAAQTQVAGTPKDAQKNRQAGQNKMGMQPSSPGEKKEGEPKKPNAVPTIADVESTQHKDKADGKVPPPKESKSNPRLTLPTTQLAGGGQKKQDDKKEEQQAEKVEEAVEKQRDLLAEFDKIADELNRVLANLEGSTLVKRLKAASRLQYKIAGRLGDQVNEVFGAATFSPKETTSKLFTELSSEEAKSSHDVSTIMDDMQAYFERRRMQQFKSVLDEMRKVDAVGSLRQLGDDLKKENGLSIAQAEYWSDTLDRWAEDLVDPSKCGACPGCKSRDSLPPSIVLEVLQVLEAEIALREETRVTEQAKAAETQEVYSKKALALSKTQDDLAIRIEKVVERIKELPEAEKNFAKELALMGQVGDVMDEATEILAKPNTASPAIAAETEAIELLLKSKRFNPKGGGGGGDSPGGGGGGTTTDAALALLGSGLNEKELKEDHAVQQSSGTTGPVLPEEFRAGLDEYFNRLEKGAKK